MSESVQQLLSSFDSLPEEERRQAAHEISKRTADFNYPDLDGEALAQIADETFLMYDAEEAADGHP